MEGFYSVIDSNYFDNFNLNTRQNQLKDSNDKLEHNTFTVNTKIPQSNVSDFSDKRTKITLHTPMIVTNTMLTSDNHWRRYNRTTG